MADPAQTDDSPPTDELYFFPGEWVALWRGRVVAHGYDFAEVAVEACRKAPDAVMAQLPDLPAWRPEFLPWA